MKQSGGILWKDLHGNEVGRWGKLRVGVMAKQNYILIKSIFKSITYKLTHIC